MDKLNITWIALCNCGAVTITIDGKDDYSMSKEMFEEKFNTLDETLKELPDQEEIQEFCNCNYCVNGWGLDLCACGSGEKMSECEEGHDCCGQPSQDLEIGQTSFKAPGSWI